MAAQILSFAAARVREPATRDWSRQELAEFYRVESALLQAGLALESERGLTDEGDPWFVFCRADTGEVFIHFAREDGWYVVDGAAFGAPARGRDFSALVRDLIASHPLATARRPGSNVMIHPAALLIALVGAAFFHSGKAKAAEPGHDHDAGGAATPSGERRGLTLNAGGPIPELAAPGFGRIVQLDATEVAAVLTGVAIGLRDVAASAATPPASPAVPMAGAAQDLVRDVVARAQAQGSAEVMSVLSALSAPDARAALTVMAVFHDLAHVAASAPPAATALVPASATLVELAARAEAAAVTGAPATRDVPPPMLAVHLASGPSPQIQALAMVTADGVLARIATDHVVHVDQLSSLLADVLAHVDPITGGGPPPSGPSGSGPSGSGPAGSGPSDGDASSGVPNTVTTTPAPDHAAKTAAPNPHAADTPADATPVTALPHAADDGASAVAPPAPITPHDDTPGGGLAAPQTSPAVLPLTPAPTLTPTPTSTPPSPSEYDQHVNAAVQAFVAMVGDVQVMITDHQVVFYDPAILGFMSPGDPLDGITWKLEDGSTVSLVGTASELHAFHGVS